MTTEEFIKELKEKFSFKNQSKNFALVKLKDDHLLTFNKKIEIRAINYLKVSNKILGFRMDRILDLESTNELLFVSGTKKKDGLYYLDHESNLITVEELVTAEDAEAWIEDWLDIDLGDYSELTADKKVALFEKEADIYLVAKTFEEFLEKVSIVTKDEFYKK